MDDRHCDGRISLVAGVTLRRVPRVPLTRMRSAPTLCGDSFLRCAASKAELGGFWCDWAIRMVRGEE